MRTPTTNNQKPKEPCKEMQAVLWSIFKYNKPTKRKLNS